MAEESLLMAIHAKGTFEVTITPQDQSTPLNATVPMGRFGLLKLFSGPLAGKAVGTMLSVGTPKPGTAAVYVALDQFVGTLAGKSGGFVLVHRGTMTQAGVSELEVRIAPDSGTGELIGVSGSLTIDVRDGKHYYDLVYTLP